MALALDAPAKVNLHLAVIGRRSDGYHEVDTVLHPLALCDTLCAELCDSSIEAAGISLEVASEATTGLAVTSDADNLVWRAAQVFCDATGCQPSIRFHLLKRIPAGGGLGGGSSDAAAALRLLNQLTGLPLAAPDLRELAAELGADVPFFLAGGSQRGRGLGCDLSPLPEVPPWHFALVLPPVGTATQAVYQNLAAELTTPSSAASMRRGPAVPDFSKSVLPMGFRNDLQASALALHPQLAELRRDLESSGFPDACMSGSGSTFFVARQDPAECADAMAGLAVLRDRHGVELVQTGSGSARLSEPSLVPYPGSTGT